MSANVVGTCLLTELNSRQSVAAFIDVTPLLERMVTQQWPVEKATLAVFKLLGDEPRKPTNSHRGFLVRCTPLIARHPFFDYDLALACRRQFGLRSYASFIQLDHLSVFSKQHTTGFCIVHSDNYFCYREDQPDAVGVALRTLGLVEDDSDKTCCVCLEPITLDTPAQFLGCRHRFHSACCQQLVDHASEAQPRPPLPSGVDWRDTIQVTCPLCRHAESVDRMGPIPNIAAMVEVMEAAKAEQIPLSDLFCI